MFMRLVHVKARVDEVYSLQSFYAETVLPVLEKTPGCLFACFLQSVKRSDEFISMTFWDSPQNAQRYEQGTFPKLLEEARPYLAESSEWRVYLTKDYKVEYQPVHEEPVVTSYAVMASPGGAPFREKAVSLYLRIVSMKVRPESKEILRALYLNEIMPAMLGIPGCRYAALVENTNESKEVISVSLWDTKRAADEYEHTGQFQVLLGRLRPMLSDLYQWKMGLQQQQALTTATSEDTTVQGYSVVLGKGFTG
jgi:heme-degrading monooxygenase HmoA